MKCQALLSVKTEKNIFKSPLPLFNLEDQDIVVQNLMKLLANVMLKFPF